MLTFQKVYTPTPAFLYNDQPLQYNVLGTIIDHKGCFKSGIQELSKKGLKVLIFVIYLMHFVIPCTNLKK
jgi:hypothetical protein